MDDPRFIAPWCPFTLAEIRVAFLGIGVPEQELDATTSSFAETVRSMNEESGYGFTEFADFLGPVAALSPDAARRVAEFRAALGQPRPPSSSEGDL